MEQELRSKIKYEVKDMFIEQMELDLDVIHAHDWHSAMVPVVIKEKYWDDPRFNKIKFVVTIHNPLYQGFPETA